MRGAVPPLPNTNSWRGAWLKKHGDNFTFYSNKYQPGVDVIGMIFIPSSRNSVS